MTLICPACNGTGFRVVDSVECGRVSIADENTIQRAFCSDCGVCFLCLFTEVRDYGGGDDRVDHTAWVADPDHWLAIAPDFEKPSSRVSNPHSIQVADEALSVYRANAPGLPIKFDPGRADKNEPTAPG